MVFGSTQRKALARERENRSETIEICIKRFYWVLEISTGARCLPFLEDANGIGCRRVSYLEGAVRVCRERKGALRSEEKKGTGNVMKAQLHKAMWSLARNRAAVRYWSGGARPGPLARLSKRGAVRGAQKAGVLKREQGVDTRNTDAGMLRAKRSGVGWGDSADRVK